MLFCIFFAFSVLYQDFAPSVRCYDSFCSFLASMSIQGAASLRVESLSPCPCCLKPSLRAQLHQIPNCSLPPSQDPGASHNGLKPSLEGS